MRATIQQIALAHRRRYVQLLRQHQTISSISRPYDNASCESFLKTLKREEIYANTNRDLEHLRTNMAAFIEQYYNRIRLHSAFGYRPPEQFERAVVSEQPSGAARMQCFRPMEDFSSEGVIEGYTYQKNTSVLTPNCLNGGVHPNPLWLNCGRTIVHDPVLSLSHLSTNLL